MNNDTYKILSVDDNEANRYAMKRILERHGYSVIEAADGKEALAKMNQDPDIVVLDVNLPDISGFEICRRIKAINSSMPVLQISASFVQTKDKVEGLESGADGYLAQPIDAAVLIATVRSLLRVRKAEKEKEILIQELKQEKEMREHFTATLTHDLRNPLGAAKMNAQFLQRQTRINEQDQNLISRIVTNINRVDLMIQDLLDVTLLKAGKNFALHAVATDLDELTSQILEDFRQTHGPRFQKTKSGKIFSGYWDPNGLKRALENLLTNAVKYGSTGTPIELSLENPTNDSMKISVLNWGNPIPESERETIFDQFERSDAAKSSGHKGWALASHSCALLQLLTAVLLKSAVQKKPEPYSLF